jgi:hypothetical protein
MNPMSDRARQSDAMIVIVYAIRPDAATDEYEEWLRRVDCPFFNAAPGVAQYVNWKVAGGDNVFARQPYFDFLVMDGIESFDAVWLDPDLNAFRRKWRELWGVTNVRNDGSHAPAYLCRRVATAEMVWTPHVALLPCAADDRLAGWDTWRIERPLRGPSPPFTAFHVRYLAGAHELAQLAFARDAAVLGARIAAPYWHCNDSAVVRAGPASSAIWRPALPCRLQSRSSRGESKESSLTITRRGVSVTCDSSFIMTTDASASNG